MKPDCDRRARAAFEEEAVGARPPYAEVEVNVDRYRDDFRQEQVHLRGVDEETTALELCKHRRTENTAADARAGSDQKSTALKTKPVTDAKNRKLAATWLVVMQHCADATALLFRYGVRGHEVRLQKRESSRAQDDRNTALNIDRRIELYRGLR